MLRVRDIEVRFGETRALAGVDLDVGDGTVVAVLGPSGCGKTTLLRVVAGLQAPDAGRVEWDGTDLAGVAPHARGFGLMFQDFALFPHKDVTGNVEFGLRMAGLPRPEVASGTARALSMVGLEGYGHRSIHNLSGGEAQRVALARALAAGPRLLMLDEPIGSLDRTLRDRLMDELRRLFVELGTTALYVTHDQEEAFAVADHLVVMRQGRVVQSGRPEAVWSKPGSEFVARFLGFSNIGDADVAGGVARTPWGALPVGLADGRHRIVIRPDAVSPRPDGPIRARVTAHTFRGDHFLVELATQTGGSLQAALRGRVGPGEALALAVDPEGIVALDE